MVTAIWVRRFVSVLIGLVALAALGGLVQAAGAIAEGKFHMVSYPAQSENIVMHSLNAAGDNAAFWQLQEGSVRVDNHTWLAIARLVGKLTGLGLVAAILWQLRGLLSRIGTGDVFNDANVAALRRIGRLLVAGSVLSISITVMTQFAILDALPDTLDGGRAVLPSLAWRVPDAENIWLEYDPPVIPMLLAMISFISAAAFRAGQAYRADSESVV